MKLVLQVELGNDAMQTSAEVAKALDASMHRHNVARYAEVGDAHRGVLAAGDEGALLDANGNTVGRWKVHA